MSMEKATLAITISLVSACASVASASFAGWLAWNDSKRMRRQDPVFEFAKGSESTEIPGWNASELTVRNREDVSLIVTTVRSKRSNGSVNSWNEACEEKRTGFGDPILKAELPQKREGAINRKVDPKGTPRHPHGLTGGDTIHLRLFTQGIDRTNDLEVSWKWADDQK